MAADAFQFFEYSRFLQGERSPEFVEEDFACLTPELFKDPESQRKVIPLYFHMTRNKGQKSLLQL